MIRVGAHGLEDDFSTLPAQAEKNVAATVCFRDVERLCELRHLVPVADPFRPHPVLSKVVFHQDPTAPLDPEDWPESEFP